MDAATFRKSGHELVEWIAEYLEGSEKYPVLSRVRPGDIVSALPPDAPEEPEPFDVIMGDFERVLVPGLTHWNHPGFMAYFAITGSAPGVLADFLSAALNQQAMLWRTSPAATELEEVTLGWLRKLIGLPGTFEGVVYDTASIATMHALVAAREAAVADVRAKGLAGRSDVPAVATTSTTSIDPVPAVVDVCARERLWMHVDAAYGGVAAMLPSHAHVLAGADRADSIVVNPHKWLFTPFDLSAFYCRRMDVVRAAFSLTPEYLRTPEAADVKNLMDTGVQLGRRFRSLKLWMILRSFGARALRARLAEHIRLAQELASWIDAHPDFERLAPVPFSVVCFRWKPAGMSWSDAEVDAANERLLDLVNASGDIFLSHTRLRGRLAIRVAIGHLRTTDEHVRRAWNLLLSSRELISTP